MSDDATVLGASEEVSQVQVPVAIDRRAGAMAEIIARAEAERQAEIESMQANIVPDPEEEALAGEQGKEEALRTVEASEVKQDEKQSEEVVRIVVDGEEREVPLSQVRDAGIRTLQKLEAADKRLEDATRLLKEAQAVAAQPQPSREILDAEESLVGTDADDEFKKLAYAIQMGDEDESTAALRKVLGMAKMPEAEIARRVDERLHIKEISTRFSAPVDKGGFADLDADPLLRQKAIDESNRLLADGEPNTWETYQRAGNAVREWLRAKAGAPQPEPEEKQPAPPTRVEIAQERKDKRTIDSLVGVGGTIETKQTPKPRTPQEIIAEIKRLRGQA